MEKSIFRKSLVIGIIILFFGASVLPVVNSMRIQNQLSEKNVDMSSNKDYICKTITEHNKNIVKNLGTLNVTGSGWVNVKFNMTFFGRTWRMEPIKWGFLTLFERLKSTDTTHKYVAILSVENNFGDTLLIKIDRRATLTLFIPYKYTTNLEVEWNSNGGYISGRAIIFFLNWQ